MLLRQDRFFKLYEVWGREIPLRRLINNKDLNRILVKADLLTLQDLLSVSSTDLVSIPGLGVTRCRKIDAMCVKVRSMIVSYKTQKRKKR